MDTLSFMFGFSLALIAGFMVKIWVDWRFGPRRRARLNFRQLRQDRRLASEIEGGFPPLARSRHSHLD
jgi:hypothetical protein